MKKPAAVVTSLSASLIAAAISYPLGLVTVVGIGLLVRAGEEWVMLMGMWGMMLGFPIATTAAYLTFRFIYKRLISN